MDSLGLGGSRIEATVHQVSVETRILLGKLSDKLYLSFELTA